MLNLFERTEGAFLRLLGLHGGTTSPTLPGETARRDRSSGGMFDVMARMMQGNKFNTDTLHPELQRKQLVEILYDMDRSGMASSILDMQTADAIEPDQDTGKALTITAPGPIKRELDALNGRLKVEENLARYTRSMAKFGDDFRRIQYTTTGGVQGLIYADPKDMEIVLDPETRDLRGYKQEGHKFRGSNKQETSWPWDFLTFSLPAKSESEVYGTGVLTPAIRSFTQLVLAEDFALLYRISRQPDRLKFEIDVGTSSEEEAMSQVHEWKKAVNHRQMIDPVGSKLRREFNPMNALENIFLPKRPNSGSSVELMQGSANVQDMSDLSYYARMFLHDTGTPPELYGFPKADGSSDPFARNKSAQNQDIRYARRIKILQRCLCAGWHRLYMIHLTLKHSQFGAALDRISPDNDIVVKLQPPSFLAELERLEVLQLRLNVANETMNMMNTAGGVFKQYEFVRYILTEIVRMKEEDVSRIIANPQAAAAASPTPEVAKTTRRTRKTGRKRGGARPVSPGTLANSIDPSSEEFGLLLNGDMRLLDSTNGHLRDAEVAEVQAMLSRSPGLRNTVQRLATLMV